MATIFHLALASDWAAAQRAGAYTTSTVGRTLAEEGFIHCSRGDQWTTVRDLYYGDVAEPLLLLQIDTDRLDVPVVEEPPEPGSTETFPHMYGPLPLDAVVKAIPVPVSGTSGGESFGRIFLTEMYFNMALVVLIMVTTVAGLGVGSAFGDEVAPLTGAVVGAVIGCVLARRLYVRRHA